MHTDGVHTNATFASIEAAVTTPSAGQEDQDSVGGRTIACRAALSYLLPGPLGDPGQVAAKHVGKG